MIQIFNVGAERMLGYSAADVMNKFTPAEISDPQEVIARAEVRDAQNAIIGYLLIGTDNTARKQVEADPSGIIFRLELISVAEPHLSIAASRLREYPCRMGS